MTGTRFSLEVQPRLPARLARLEELANDLYYSWDKSVRNLLFRLDHELWEASGHNPKVFLRRIAQDKLDAALREYRAALPLLDEDAEAERRFIGQALEDIERRRD